MKLSALALAAALVVTGAAAASAAPHTAVVSLGTYADYSTMLTAGTTTPGGTAGQGWTTSASSQWAWNPQGGGASNILWGSPSTWPVGTIEHFTTNANWVELPGWSNTTDGLTSNIGQDYTQNVTSESLGFGDCSTMLPIPVDNGHEIYAMWNVPASTYCLDAAGVITSPENPLVHITFEHWQQWSTAACANAYYSGDTCIVQAEKWWDDHGHAFSLQIDRTSYLAKGKGWYSGTNRVLNGVPNTTSWNGRYFWTW